MGLKKNMLLVNGSPCKYRLYGESMEIRDLETRGPWAVASERSEDTTKGPRVSKSRISIGRAVQPVYTVRTHCLVTTVYSNKI